MNTDPKRQFQACVAEQDAEALISRKRLDWPSAMAKPASSPRLRLFQKAFSLVETTFAIALLGLSSAALLSGLVSSVSTIQAQRETLRATEIMTEKLDTIRLYSWTQLGTAGYITNSFQVSFYPTNQLSGAGIGNSGLTYTGTVSIANLVMSESYSNSLKLITVGLSWSSGRRFRSAQMSTLVSQHGMQSFVY